MVKNLILICEECLSRNYHYKKSQTTTKRLELKKYCPKCNRNTVHKESK